jgi:hypothetical protein
MHVQTLLGDRLKASATRSRANRFLQFHAIGIEPVARLPKPANLPLL